MLKVLDSAGPPGFGPLVGFGEDVDGEGVGPKK